GQMAAFGERFHRPGDRKITLNFALAAGNPADPQALLRHFDPARYLVKITPVNPTWRATQNGLASFVDPSDPSSGASVAEAMRAAGYDTILSIGEVEENEIGSNCGQYVLKYLEEKQAVEGGYSYLTREVV
ncbi:MAG: radical SAM protein, partial [Chloroflexota bacterium]